MADAPDPGGTPATPIQSAMNYWAHFATLLLGLVGTAIGIFATYQSNVANSQAKTNADRLQTLQVQLQAANTFANGIHKTVSKVSGTKITARWVYVGVAASPVKSARATNAPAASPSAIASCTAPAQVPSR